MLAPGLYQGPWNGVTGEGNPTIWVVENGTKRGITSWDNLFVEFGPNAIDAVHRNTSPAALDALTTLPPIYSPSPRALPGESGGILSTLADTVGNIFGVPISGGGTLTIGNQTIPGNMWMWFALALVLVFVLARRG